MHWAWGEGGTAYTGIKSKNLLVSKFGALNYNFYSYLQILG